MGQRLPTGVDRVKAKLPVKLTDDQYKIYLMLRDGYSQQEIADAMRMWRLRIYDRISTLALNGVVSRGVSGIKNSNKVLVKPRSILLKGEEPIDGRWRTSTVLGLAWEMRKSGEFGIAPILADALQDAGCGGDGASDLILSTLRRPFPEVTIPPEAGPEPETPAWSHWGTSIWDAYAAARDAWAVVNQEFEKFMSGETDPRVHWRFAIRRVVDRLM